MSVHTHALSSSSRIAIEMEAYRWPSDIAETIFEHAVVLYEDDPAKQWTWGRHLSAHQKRCIELRFKTTWLPRLRITLHRGTLRSDEYIAQRTLPGDMAVFVHDHTLFSGKRFGGELSATDLFELWARKEIARPILRLGEGHLKRHGLEAWIVNDTEIPDLHVATTDKTITFNWVGAMNALLREESMMQSKRAHLIQTVRLVEGNTSVESRTDTIFRSKIDTTHQNSQF